MSCHPLRLPRAGQVSSWLDPDRPWAPPGLQPGPWWDLRRLQHRLRVVPLPPQWRRPRRRHRQRRLLRWLGVQCLTLGRRRRHPPPMLGGPRLASQASRLLPSLSSLRLARRRRLLSWSHRRRRRARRVTTTPPPRHQPERLRLRPPSCQKKNWHWTLVECSCLIRRSCHWI